MARRRLGWGPGRSSGERRLPKGRTSLPARCAAQHSAIHHRNRAIRLLKCRFGSPTKCNGDGLLKSVRPRSPCGTRAHVREVVALDHAGLRRTTDRRCDKDTIGHVIGKGSLEPGPGRGGAGLWVCIKQRFGLGVQHAGDQEAECVGRYSDRGAPSRCGPHWHEPCCRPAQPTNRLLGAPSASTIARNPMLWSAKPRCGLRVACLRNATSTAL